MAVQGLAAADAVIVAFDDHLRRARGIGSSARESYSRFARDFLEAVLGDGPVDLARLGVPDVVGFVTEAAARYRPSTVRWRRLSRWCPAAGWRPCRGTLVLPTSPA
jgi:hypothetical protein